MYTYFYQLKLDHCDDESVVVDNVEDESRVQEPASDKSQETVVEESRELLPSGNDATPVPCENTDETQGDTDIIVFSSI